MTERMARLDRALRLVHALVEAGEGLTLDDIARLPFTEKDELRATQAAAPPFGEHLAADPAELMRVFSTSGTTGVPCYLGLTRSDLDMYATNVARGYTAAGFSKGQRIAVGFNAGPFVAGAALASMDRLGLCHIPVGTGNSERLVKAIDRLAAAGRDRLVHVWDAANGVALFSLAGHSEFIYSIAYSPDGKRLASGAQDGTVKFWSLEPRQEVLSIPVAETAAGATSPDGTRIAYDVSGDGPVLMLLHGAGQTRAEWDAIGYLGGTIGPDLTHIARIRQERDLLESIVFPSASFVRSYEPVKVTTLDGRAFSGVLRKDAPDEVVLAVTATEEVRIARKDIDELTREKTGMTFLKVQMNPDLLTADLKKKRARNESFWLMGQPDAELRAVVKLLGHVPYALCVTARTLLANKLQPAQLAAQLRQVAEASKNDPIRMALTVSFGALNSALQGVVLMLGAL